MDRCSNCAELERELKEIDSYRRGLNQRRLIQSLPLPESVIAAMEAVDAWAIEAHDFAEDGMPPDPGFICNMCGGCGETRDMDHADTCPMPKVRAAMLDATPARAPRKEQP